jgi:RIP metalloprotease RseP
VRYASGGRAAEGRMNVPSSIVNQLSLPPEAVVNAVNGQTYASIADKTKLPLPNPVALGMLLRQHAGQTVKISYKLSEIDPVLREADFAVLADASNADPWQMRIVYSHTEDLQFAPRETPVKTSSPVYALYLGARHTGLVLMEVYHVVEGLGRSVLSRHSNPMQQVSGPVGIVGHAIDKAKQGYGELLFFLAFLSVNLAVLNFIPFPVVDGGLMVFLIIEKVKGTPLSFKTQMWATVVGLATIILIFLLVTIQDITKLFNR